MINLLFVSLIFMLIYSYVLSGRDFFAPATVQILTFAATVFTCIYFMRSMDCPYDFGWVGTFVLHGVSMIFLSVFYEYVKRRRGNMGILIFGQMYYTVVMSFFAERFFSNIVSLNYIKQLLMLLILYELLIRKRIRFKFRRTASSK